MSNQIKDTIFSSRVGKIVILVYAVYTMVWGIIEPLDLDWIKDHKFTWRIILIISSVLVTIILSIRLSSSILDEYDTDRLQDSYSSTGNPNVSIQQDGLNIKGSHGKDEMDWAIKHSAQRAKRLEIIFKNKKDFSFYTHVVMSNKNNKPITRWVRYDSRLVDAEKYNGNLPAEMGVDYKSDSLGSNSSFNKAIINIEDAVKRTYGQAGWQYEKTNLFRIRCDEATIKNISFKR